MKKRTILLLMASLLALVLGACGFLDILILDHSHQDYSFFDQVDRVVSENPADTLLAFFDLGSAKMNLKMVTDFSDKSIIINRVPIVEGAYNAAALLQAGAELSVIQIQLAELEINK